MKAKSPTREWTQDQRRGIVTTDRSLLVSAAAGSGKTSVLAERRVHLVCDASPRCGVDELLVVTFTEAAAAEMKARIQKALADRHAGNPSNHTARQLAIIDRASVGTLHSFCSRLLRQHFHLLGLDPAFIILDADESDLLKLEVARDMFADWYDREENADPFRKFINSYGDGNDERIIRLVLQAHDTLASLLDPDRWIRNARDRIASAITLPISKSALGREYSKTLGRYLHSMGAECAAAGIAVKQLKNFPDYVAHLRELWTIINHWTKVFDQFGLDAFIEEAATVELPEIPRVSNKVEGKEIAKERVDGVRNALKKGPWREALVFTDEEWKDGLRRIQPHTDTFLSLVEDFTDRYGQAKQEEGALDFSDLERFTLKALRDPTIPLAEPVAGDDPILHPSPIARSYHRQFKHVLVDEYQDINEVQDSILKLISRECITARSGTTPNLFCVGDVKQSIYRFRLAEPARFLARRAQYSQPKTHGTVVDLQKNFRSRAPLLNAINGVFKTLMTEEAAELNYDHSQELKPGLDYPDITDGSCFNGAPIELHLLPRPGGSSVAAEDEPSQNEPDRTEREAMLLVERIFEMTGKTAHQAMNVVDRAGDKITCRPIRFGDIVILLRSMRYKADQFVSVLRSAGIPVHSESATGYFEATEVNDLLALLKILDNQQQDIPLAAVLRSPLAALPQAEENLARIRLAYAGDPAIPFHQAVARYASEQKDELAASLRDFRNQLDGWRKLARQRPLAEVLWSIYDDTGYLAFSAGLAGGEQRQANLIELHERARQFGTFRRQGLSRFLQFLEKLKAESDLGQASIASEAEDVVRVMSIHRSKGLEFPVVLLPDLGKAFNLQDSQGSILLDRNAGLGLQVVDEDRRIRYPSLASAVVQQRLRRQSLAEELRVLYVAMTRAKEHLILVGTCNESQPEKWAAQWRGHEGPLPTEQILNARNMLDWLGPTAAALNRGGDEPIRVHAHTAADISTFAAVQPDAAKFTSAQTALAALKPLNPSPPPNESAARVIERVSFQYPFKAFTKLGAVQSVTSLSKQTSVAAQSTDPSSAPPPGTAASELDRMLPKPAFLAGELPIDPAERGTATHLVLQHLTFSDVAGAASIHRQIEKMIGDHRLTSAQSKLVDIPAIQWFLSEDIGQLLQKHAADIMREAPVYYAAPANIPTANIDKFDNIMVRGRLDLILPIEGEFIIIDYKTDRVSGDLLDQRAAFYAGQLRLYGKAIEKITQKKVREMILVFLSARECRRV